MPEYAPGFSNGAPPDAGWPGDVGISGGGGSSNALGSPSNPVTNAAAARPTGLTVVYALRYYG